MKIYPERIKTLNAAQLLHLAAASSSVLLHPDRGGKEEQEREEAQEETEEEEKEEEVPPAYVQYQLSCLNLSGTSTPHSTDDLLRCNCSVSPFRRSKVRGRQRSEKLLTHLVHTLING